MQGSWEEWRTKAQEDGKSKFSCGCFIGCFALKTARKAYKKDLDKFQIRAKKHFFAYLLQRVDIFMCFCFFQ